MIRCGGTEKGRLTGYAFCLRYIAPVLLTIILVGDLWQEGQSVDAAKAVRWVWLVAALLIAGSLAQGAKRKSLETAV